MTRNLSLHLLFDSNELIGFNFDSQHQKLNIGHEPNLAKKFKAESNRTDYDPNRLKRNE